MNITNYTSPIKSKPFKALQGSENFHECKLPQLGDYTPLDVDQEWDTFQDLINQ